MSGLGDISSAKKTWGEGLYGLRREEIIHGMNTIMKGGMAWAPSLPEFRALCRPKREPESEFSRAANILGSDPVDWGGDAVLYWTVQAVGSYEVRSKPYSAMKAKWCQALRDFEGECSLPAPPEPRLSLPVLPSTKEVARANLAAAKAAIGMGGNHAER